MQMRQLGTSDLKISPVIFGAWAIGGWMWGGQDQADSIEAIRAAIDNGVTTIDTAAIYGMGFSEQIVANYKFETIGRLQAAVRGQGLPEEVFPELYER